MQYRLDVKDIRKILGLDKETIVGLISQQLNSCMHIMHK